MMQAALALAIFIVAFVFIATERVNKVKVVLIAAAAMIVTGIVPGAEVFYSQHEGIDWNVIFLLFGMMNWVYTWYDEKRDGSPADVARAVQEIFLSGMRGGAGGSASRPT